VRDVGSEEVGSVMVDSYLSDRIYLKQLRWIVGTGSEGGWGGGWDGDGGGGGCVSFLLVE